MAYQNSSYTTDLEMHPYQPPAQAQPQSTLPLNDFLARVQKIRAELRALTAEVQQITTLHQRVLSSTHSASLQRELDNLVTAAQDRNRAVREAIQLLKVDVEGTVDTAQGGGGGGLFSRKKAQVESLTAEFKSVVQSFLVEEQRYRERCREQVARQYRVVYPGASEEEVRRAVEEGGEGVFQNALQTNQRTTQASSTLGAVRVRQHELQNIEQSIAELARLFQDLETLVILDEPKIAHIDVQTEQADFNITKGIEQVGIAQRSALNRRRVKWILLGVVVAIVIIVALAVVIWLKVTGMI